MLSEAIGSHSDDNQLQRALRTVLYTYTHTQRKERKGKLLTEVILPLTE